MSSQTVPPSSKESKATASAAGVSGGTLLVVIASLLDDNNAKLKLLLIWAAPSVSVILSGLWLWLLAKLSNHLRDRELKQRIDITKRMLEEALNKPDTGAERRAEIRKQIEELQQINISRQMERIKSLRILSEEDMIGRTGST